MNITILRRIAAHYVYHRRSLIRNAIVSWLSDGTVGGVTVCDDIDSQAGVEFYNGILVPDMVNAHCHLELSYLKGMIPQGGGFTAFARNMATVRGVASTEEREHEARRGDECLWRQGVGAVGDICNGSSTFPAKVDSHVSYLNFLELYGLGAVSADVLEPVAAQAAKAGLTAVVTPHSTYSLQDAAFRSAAGYGERTGLPLSLHFMESPAEKELFKGRGELAEWFALRGTPADFAGYGSPALRITSSVPSGRDIMLVHNCFATEEDIDIIEGYFTGRVTWVLCPCSNLYISGIAPPVSLLRRKGVRIAVGTDSLASNTAFDMVAEMKELGGVPLEESLCWVTENGAVALGLDDRMKGFEAGSRTGAVLITGLDWNTMQLTKESHAERIF